METSTPAPTMSQEDGVRAGQELRSPGRGTARAHSARRDLPGGRRGLGRRWNHGGTRAIIVQGRVEDLLDLLAHLQALLLDPPSLFTLVHPVALQDPPRAPPLDPSIMPATPLTLPAQLILCLLFQR